METWFLLPHKASIRAQMALGAGERGELCFPVPSRSLSPHCSFPRVLTPPGLGRWGVGWGMTPNGSWVVWLTVRALHAAGAQELADAWLWATSLGVRDPGPGLSVALLPDAADGH